MVHNEILLPMKQGTTISIFLSMNWFFIVSRSNLLSMPTFLGSLHSFRLSARNVITSSVLLELS